MVTSAAPDGAGVIEGSRRSESGVLPASCRSLLVEEVACNRVVNNHSDSTTTYLPSYIPSISEGKDYQRTRDNDSRRPWSGRRMSLSHRLDSEPNCRQSKPWTTRPHVSVIGSCTLAFQARELTPWKSTSRGNSFITFIFLSNIFAFHNTIIQVSFSSSQVSVRTEITATTTSTPGLRKQAGWGNHHTPIQLPKHTQDSTPGQ